MDGFASDLLLRELRRIKWLLLLILLTLLSLPVFLLYIGWEVAGLLQENQLDGEGGSVETSTENHPRRGFTHEPVLVINRSAGNSSPDERGAGSSDRHTLVKRPEAE